MAELQSGCTRVEVDDSNYSSFVPIIGWYMAGVSLVCFVALSYDLFSVFRHKKRWLPCQLCSLNSVTLTVLGIAAKLPVDLTSSMPTPLDQFSKLTGTSLICISMGFLMPSLGTTPKSETLSNMLALSIFVVTVVVNICVQIRTGVTFLFIVEHFMVMCFMLVMLMVLWFCFMFVAGEKDVWLDCDKTEFMAESYDLLKRSLKIAYVNGFIHDPQFLLCTNNQINAVTGLCIACSVVTLQAAIRNLSLAFCGGSSDYGLSVWVIVLVQILIVVVGSAATVFRCLGLSTVVEMPWSDMFIEADARMELDRENRSSFLALNSRDRCSLFLIFLMSKVAWLFYVSVCVPLRYIFYYIGFGLNYIGFGLNYIGKSTEDIEDDIEDDIEEDSTEDIEDDILLIEGNLQKWGVEKGMKDMKKWKKMSKSQSVKKLSHLLESFSPSKKFHEIELSEDYWNTLDNIHEVSSLTVAVLVSIARILLTSEQSASLWAAYVEVYEIIHFVEDKMKTMDIESRKKPRLAEAVRRGRIWKNPNTQGSDEAVTRNPETNGTMQSQLEFLDKEFPAGLISDEIRYIKEHIGRSTDKLCCIQQLFVDIVHMFLTQLRPALCKGINDGTAEDFHERVKTSLRIFWTVEPLKMWPSPTESDPDAAQMEIV